jgi:hypothetical protein
MQTKSGGFDSTLFACVPNRVGGGKVVDADVGIYGAAQRWQRDVRMPRLSQMLLQM